MNVDSIASAAAALGGLALSGVFALHYRSIQEAKRQGEYELKVDTMWEFQLRRGMVEARMSDILQRNSPISTTDRARAALINFAADLRDFYSNGGRTMTDVDQFIAIELKLGDRMVEEVCLPLRISQGACVLAAMVYGRELTAEV